MGMTEDPWINGATLVRYMFGDLWPVGIFSDFFRPHYICYVYLQQKSVPVAWPAMSSPGKMMIHEWWIFIFGIFRASHAGSRRTKIFHGTCEASRASSLGCWDAGIARAACQKPVSLAGDMQVLDLGCLNSI